MYGRRSRATYPRIISVHYIPSIAPSLKSCSRKSIALFVWTPATISLVSDFLQCQYLFLLREFDFRIPTISQTVRHLILWPHNRNRHRHDVARGLFARLFTQLRGNFISCDSQMRQILQLIPQLTSVATLELQSSVSIPSSQYTGGFSPISVTVIATFRNTLRNLILDLPLEVYYKTWEPSHHSWFFPI